MGIPSYFSYIVKNHSNIIKKLCDIKNQPNNFYMDSNSIIYDCLREIQIKYKNYKPNEFEDLLIMNICKKIDDYVEIIKPNKTVYIAFDGVAPFAKLEQQKNRRYKSALDDIIKKKLGILVNKCWNKSAITPGTKFMKKLGTKVSNYYKTKDLHVEHIIISSSNEVGEGEHKIFEYIRSHPIKHKNEVTFIYGLDSDLIMLCLNHLHIAPELYLFRETPEFIKSIDKSLEPNESYVMDIPQLSSAIIKKMNNQLVLNDKQRINRLYDYIFLCFFLGNDFMPHFPAVNIRTKGINIMFSAYQNTIGKTNGNLTDGKKFIGTTSENWWNIYLITKNIIFLKNINIVNGWKNVHIQKIQMRKNFLSLPIYQPATEF